MYMDNDEVSYNAKRYFMKMAGYVRAGQVEAYVRSIYPFGFPEMDNPDEMNSVNWHEIAESWNLEYDEEMAD